MAVIESRPLAELMSVLPKSGESVLAASQKYHYQQNNQHLQIEMCYILKIYPQLPQRL